MQLKARLGVSIVEMTDALQVSLYWSWMREWALDFKAECSDQDPTPSPGTGPEWRGAGGEAAALVDGIWPGQNAGTSQYQRSTTV